MYINIQQCIYKYTTMYIVNNVSAEILTDRWMIHFRTNSTPAEISTQ